MPQAPSHRPLALLCVNNAKGFRAFGINFAATAALNVMGADPMATFFFDEETKPNLFLGACFCAAAGFFH